MTEEEEGELPASQQFGMKVLAVVRPPPEEEQPQDRVTPWGGFPHSRLLEKSRPALTPSCSPQKHQAPVGILRRFPFSSSFQRMSVLVKLPGEAAAHAYVKGAPEMVASLCRKETGSYWETGLTPGPAGSSPRELPSGMLWGSS